MYTFQRPITQAGRPITGFLRPGTQSGRPGTMEQAIRTPRTAYTARPITSSSGRFVRLGTVNSVSFTTVFYYQSNFMLYRFLLLLLWKVIWKTFYRWFFFTYVAFIIFMLIELNLCFRKKSQDSCSLIFPHRLPCLQVLMDLL